MTRYPEVYILRHGQTEWNAARRMQGGMDSPLTPLGTEQARAMGALLTDAGLRERALPAFVSPQSRARLTAAECLAPLGQEAAIDPRLRELTLGAWDGLTWDEIRAGWPDIFASNPHGFDRHYSAPGGQSFDDHHAVCESFLRDLSGPAILITHGMTSRMLRGIWLGLGREGIRALPGGQGVIFHLAEGGHHMLRP